MNQTSIDLQTVIEEVKQSEKTLIVSFEDSKLIKEISQKIYPSKYEYLTKADINGIGLIKILKLIRKHKYDFFLLSNRFSQVNRTRASLELLALFTKANNIFILYDENEIVRYNKFSLFKTLAPKVLAGLFLGIFVYLKIYLYIIYYDIRYRRKKSKIVGDAKTILYLRTDLAGKLLAGGSVTHIEGFISGAKNFNFNVVYCSDYPLRNQPISLVIKPNKYLEIFDEFQLIDYNFKVIKILKRILRKNPPGLIYHRYSIFNASSIILGSLLNVPVIIEMNHSEVWVKKNWSRLVLEKLATKIEKFVIKKADLISVVSEVTKEEITNLGANPDKIVVNPNGVDPEKFSPSVDGSNVRSKFNLNDYFVVGFIGTFTRWHGIETLFDAAIKVLGKNHQIKFLLIGDGNLKSQLELKTHQLNLDEKIIFTGLVPHDDAPKYLAACDILISPHLGFEDGTKFFGSPTKLFEYMAMGKAVIASDLEQIGKIITNGVNGLKFNPGDVDKLSELILKLFADKELREKLGKKAREDVIQHYTWQENAFRVLSKFYNL